MSKISGKSREKLHSFGDHHKFLSRISKTLYYTKLPKTDRLSLPVTELASELFSETRNGKSIDRLHCNEAATISRNACVSPCSLVLALLYLDRLKSCNPEYMQRVIPSELFLVSLMVSSKFLYDDGEDDEVCMKDWAASGEISLQELKDLEKDFLNAIEWNVFVGELEFWRKLHFIERTIASRQGNKRGWFTYMELQTLVSTLDIQSLVHVLVSFMTIIVTAYTAAILTIVGSMYILSTIPGNCLRSTIHDQTISSNNHYLHYATPEQNILKSIDESMLDIVNAENSTPDTMAHKKSLDAVDVLKAGIILASIKTTFKSRSEANNTVFDFDDELESDVENVSWDWWSSSTLSWLSKTSKLIETFTSLPSNFGYTHNENMEKCIANCKKLELEDQIHKSTKVRIQDQLESTWHTEWTDTITSTMYSYRPFTYYFVKH